MSAFMTTIGSVITAAIGWLGTTISALFSENGQLADLLPFLALSIGVGLVGLGVKYVRSFIKIGG